MHLLFAEGFPCSDHLEAIVKINLFSTKLEQNLSLSLL